MSDTTYNIRDFIVNSLAADKYEAFMADVNNILKDTEVVGPVSVDDLRHAWRVFYGDPSSEKAKEIDVFADKWYGETHLRWNHARFVIRNLHAAKRMGYCVTDGKLF